MGLLNEKGIYKLTSTPITVALDAVAATTLYTVPSGKIMIPFGVSIVVGGDAGASVLTLGRSTALTDFIASITMGSIDAAGDLAWCLPVPNATPVVLKTYAAGIIFSVDVTTGSGHATNYFDLFGWLKDA